MNYEEDSPYKDKKYPRDEYLSVIHRLSGTLRWTRFNLASLKFAMNKFECNKEKVKQIDEISSYISNALSSKILQIEADEFGIGDLEYMNLVEAISLIQQRSLRNLRTVGEYDF